MAFFSSPAAEHNPFADPLPPLWLYFSFKGRITRRTFWCHGIFVLLLSGMTVGALLNIAGMSAEEADGIVNLLLAWPGLAVLIKRCHDRDRSAWWVLLTLIPLVGSLWILIDNGLLRGTRGENRFGPEPVV